MPNKWLRRIAMLCALLTCLAPAKARAGDAKVPDSLITTVIIGGALLVTAAVGLGVVTTIFGKQVAVPARAYDEAALWLAAGGAEPPPLLLRAMMAAYREQIGELQSNRLSDREVAARLLAPSTH